MSKQLRGSAATAVIAAALRDADRLDWLEEQANKPGGLLLHDGSETGRSGLGLRPGYLVRSLREAIDDARGMPSRVAFTPTPEERET